MSHQLLDKRLLFDQNIGSRTSWFPCCFYTSLDSIKHRLKIRFSFVVHYWLRFVFVCLRFMIINLFSIDSGVFFCTRSTLMMSNHWMRLTSSSSYKFFLSSLGCCCWWWWWCSVLIFFYGQFRSRRHRNQLYRTIFGSCIFSRIGFHTNFVIGTIFKLKIKTKTNE